MNNAGRVRRRESVRDLYRDLDGPGHGQSAAFDQVTQWRAADKLGGDPINSIIVSDLVNLDNVGMTQSACRTSFALKAQNACGIPHRIWREDLESYVTFQVQIQPSIDIAHAAPSDQLQNFEVVELVPTLQLWTLVRGSHRRIFQKTVGRVSGIQKRQDLTAEFGIVRASLL